jgi:hypothetical protein
MVLSLKYIVKPKLQKILDANFIYPITYGEWESPLVIFSKKGGKWRICVDRREINKFTRMNHFPLPLFNQVLDALYSKKYFSFLYGFSGYNQIQINSKDQVKTTLIFPWETFAYRVLPFGLCNVPITFKRVALSIISPSLGFL